MWLVNFFNRLIFDESTNVCNLGVYILLIIRGRLQ